MSTAPCPDPHEDHAELFKSLREVFEDVEWVSKFGYTDPDTIEREIAKFAAWCDSTPDGKSPYEQE